MFTTKKQDCAPLKFNYLITQQNDATCQNSGPGVIFRMRELLTHGFHTIKLANYLVQKGNTFLLVAQFFPSYILEESEKNTLILKIMPPIISY